MSDRVLLATFEHEDDLLAATDAVRRGGFEIVDAFTPYAVHGLERAMGLRPSRLTWVCFLCGMTGVLGMLWFEHWTASIDWQLDVGGKPWNSLPSDVPVAFEAAVLLAVSDPCSHSSPSAACFPASNHRSSTRGSQTIVSSL